MRKSRCTEKQVAFALKQAELGTPVAEVCRKMGVSEARFFRWKQTYGGLGPSELCRRPHRPEDEMQAQVEDPNIVYGVAGAPPRLRLRGVPPPGTGPSTKGR